MASALRKGRRVAIELREGIRALLPSEQAQTSGQLLAFFSASPLSENDMALGSEAAHMASTSSEALMPCTFAVTVTGGGPCFAHVTLRTSDIAADLTHYRDRLGMTLLSRQAVPAYGFTLYFPAHTLERPPDPDLDSVNNRPWLWQRPYPMLELQAFNPTTSQINTVQDATGLDSLLFEPRR